MKKSRGQALSEFAVIAVMGFSILLIGVFVFGDDLANVFAGSNPERRFNTSRTVRYENPEDLISNIEIVFDGSAPFKPPVEKVLEVEGYVQTSGSAGQVAQMGRIMEEYINQLKTVFATAGTPAPFVNALDDYQALLRDGANGFLAKFESDAGKPLEQKIDLLEMVSSQATATAISAIAATKDTYVLTIGGTRKEIVENFTDDLLNIGNYIDYYIDASLYMQYLGQEKALGNPAQDRALLEEIRKHLNGDPPYDGAGDQLTDADEKANLASLMQINYSGGFSQVSPSMYNGQKMCETFLFNRDMITATTCRINL